MARLPGRACRHPGCPEIVRGPDTHCEEHRAEARRDSDRLLDKRRGTSSERGYDAKWQRFREWFLSRAGNQYCHRCLELDGEIVKAEVVHHVIPVSERPDLRLVPDNCQPLCYQCHTEVHRVGG